MKKGLIDNYNPPNKKITKSGSLSLTNYE